LLLFVLLLESIMNQLSKVIAAGAIVASSLIVPSAAQAGWDHCQTGETGAKVCGYAGQRFDVLRVSGDGMRETFVIQCRTSDSYAYQSWGNLTQAQADGMAEAYCEGHGGGHYGGEI
jgi:hypothetical protein